MSPGGGDQQLFQGGISLYCLVFSKSSCVAALWDEFVVFIQ